MVNWNKDEYIIECVKRGEQILALAKELHGEQFLWGVALHRSALVFLKKDPVEPGRIVMWMYHDPEWRGDEITLESIVRYREAVEIVGQRHGPDINRIQW